MKAIYEFEQELLKDYDFEPVNEGYNIDDLSEADRQELSGMLWILFDAVQKWEINESEENSENGTLGQIANEYLGKTYQRLIDEIISSVQDFVISRLDATDFYVEQ